MAGPPGIGALAISRRLGYPSLFVHLHRCTGLSKVMTEDNRVETLPKFFHRSRQEAKELVAEIRPVEKVPERTVVTVERTVGSAVEPRPTHPERVQIETPRTLVEPMTATLSRIHLTASRDFLALLEKAKAGQTHVQPAAHPRRLHLRRHGQARGGPHPTARPGRPLHGRQLQDPLQTP